MIELVKIRIRQDGAQVVSARDLHAYLVDGSTNHTTKWLKANIQENTFAIEGLDFQKVHTKGGGNQTLDDYALTFDFAKRLAMMTKTAKGEEIRNYFIECEKKIKGVESFGLPQDYKSALKALINQIEINEQVEERLQAVQPKVDFYDKVAESNEAVSMDKAAQLLKTGRTRLFNELRAKSIMKPNSTTPYQKYVDAGYFVLIEKPWTHEKSGETRISITTQVTQKGIQYINERIL